MDLGELQVFLTVAREGSFSRAAERLYRTQPAVSLPFASSKTASASRCSYAARAQCASLTPAHSFAITPSASSTSAMK